MLRCTVMPSDAAIRAPARPASASPTCASNPSSGRLRRRRRAVSPSTCSANVVIGQTELPQKNRRTARRMTIGRAPTGPSWIWRTYPLCTRDDHAPQARHAAPAEQDRASTSTLAAPHLTWSMRRPSRWGRSSPSPAPSRAATGTLAGGIAEMAN